MKHCEYSHQCEWGNAFEKNVCAYKENMEEWELCPKILENWETHIDQIDRVLKETKILKNWDKIDTFFKRHGMPKDCLSCAQSFSADDDNDDMVLLCVKNNNYIQVPEDGSCNEWKD